MSLQVSWGKRKFSVQFFEEYQQYSDQWTRQVTLRQLMEKCSSITKVPVENMKLLYAGVVDSEASIDWLKPLWRFFDSIASEFSSLKEDKSPGSFVIMKDLSAVLSKYNLKHGSKIVMLGDASTPATYYKPNTPPLSTTSLKHSESSEPVSKSRTEALFIQRLESIHAEAKEVLFPMIQKYKEDSTSVLNRGAFDQTFSKKYMKDSHAKVSEMIMQMLLKLDGVICDSSFEGARLKRKELVKIFQDWLDNVDNVKDQISKINMA